MLGGIFDSKEKKAEKRRIEKERIRIERENIRYLNMELLSITNQNITYLTSYINTLNGNINTLKGANSSETREKKKKMRLHIEKLQKDLKEEIFMSNHYKLMTK